MIWNGVETNHLVSYGYAPFNLLEGIVRQIPYRLIADFVLCYQIYLDLPMYPVRFVKILSEETVTGLKSSVLAAYLELVMQLNFS